VDEEKLRLLWEKTVQGADLKDLSPDETYQFSTFFRSGWPEQINFDPNRLPTLLLDSHSQNKPAIGPSHQTLPLSKNESLNASQHNEKEESEPSYQFQNEIGRGGMGVIFRARQTSLHRDVAIKKIRPDIDDHGLRNKFVSEAIVTGRLDHPNIVPIYDLGANTEGEYLLSMKLVDGLCWRDVLRSKDRTVGSDEDLEQQLSVLKSVCHAMAFAHSHGVVHCDLKPENVMIGEFGEVLVMDWGLAVDIRESPDVPLGTPCKDVTNPCGTPAYMPPELALGTGEEIAPETDVYLLGSILHEILTGRPPHRGKSFLSVLYAAVRSDTPDFSKDLPQELTQICQKALAAKKADRYPSASAFQDALGDFLEHKESLKIARIAGEMLDRCINHGASIDRDRLYNQYAEAVAGFRQAIHLWSANREAVQGVDNARLAFAREALSRADLGLARAQVAELDANAPDTLSLRGTIEAAARDRAKEAQKLALQRSLLIGAVLTIVIGLIIGMALIRAESQRAQRNKDDALKQKSVALREKARATAARDKAKQETKRAQAAEKRALVKERESRILLANSLVTQGFVVAADHRWGDARDLYKRSEEILGDLGLSVFPPMLGQWEAAQKSPLALQTFAQSTGSILHLVLHPGGQWAATAHRNKYVALWDIVSGRHIRSFVGFKERVYSIGFSADGQYMVAGCGDGTLSWWATQSGRRLWKVQASTQAITTIAVTPDGQRALTGSNDGNCKLWAFGKKRALWTAIKSRKMFTPGRRRPKIKTALPRFRYEVKGIRTVAISADGRFGAAGTSKSRIHVFDLSRFQTPAVLESHLFGVNDLAFSKDGQFLASVGGDRLVNVWRMGQYKEIFRSLSGDSSHGTMVTFNEDSSAILAASKDGTVRLWNLADGLLQRTYFGHQSSISGLAVSPSQPYAVSAGVHDSGFVWNLDTEPGTQVFPKIRGGTQTLQVSSEKHLGLILQESIKVIDLATGTVLKTFEKPVKPSKGAMFSADGRGVLYYGPGHIALVDIESGEQRCAASVEKKQVLGLIYSKARDRYIAGTENEILILDPMTLKIEKSIPNPKHKIRAIDCDSTGQTVVCAGTKGELWIRDLNSGAIKKRLKFQDNAPTTIQFNRSGTQVYGASWSYGTVHLKVWDVQSGKRLFRKDLDGHSDYVQALDFSSAGPWLLSASRDGTIKIWDVTNAQDIRTIKGPVGPFRQACFSRDGRLVLAMSHFGEPMVFDLEHPRRISEAAPSLERANKALRDRPDSQDALLQLGGWYSIRGFHRVAATLYDRVHRVESAEATNPILWQMMWTQWRTQRFSQALKTLQSCPTTSLEQQFYARLCQQHLQRANQDQEKFASIPETIHFQPIPSRSSCEGLLLGHWDGGVSYWDLKQRRVTWSRKVGRSPVWAQAFHEKRGFYATGSRAGDLTIHDFKTGSILSRVAKHKYEITQLLFSADGSILITGERYGAIRAFRVSNGEELWLAKKHTGTISSFSLTPDGKRFLSAEDGGSIHVWNVADGKIVQTLAKKGPWGNLLISPDGAFCLAVGRAGLYSWDLKSGMGKPLPQAVGLKLRRLVMASDGRGFYSQSRSGEITEWNWLGEKLRVHRLDSTDPLKANDFALFNQEQTLLYLSKKQVHFRQAPR
jgi:WD40 repeat protein/serine/threonine protein kinase